MGTKALVSLAACVVVVMAFIGVRQAQPEGATSPEKPEPPTQAAPVLSPAGVPADQRPVDNSSCLLCHPSLADEMITKAHAKGGTLCVDCHGLSRRMRPVKDWWIRRICCSAVARSYRSARNATKHPISIRIGWTPLLPSGKDGFGPTVGRSPRTASVPIAMEHTMSVIGRLRLSGFPCSRQDLTGWQTEGNAVWKVEKGMLIGTQGQ